MKTGSIALISTFLGAFACAQSEVHSRSSSTPPVLVRTHVVKKQAFPLVYRGSGTVRGRTTATLTSKTVGYVRMVGVRSGDAVRAGQILAELEADDVRAGVAKSRAAVSLAAASKIEGESGLEAARVSAKLAKTNYERAVGLFARGVISEEQRDESEARHRAAAAQEQMARARLDAVISSVDQAKASLLETQATLGYAKIAAPFTGRVLERLVDPGALASPGTPLFVLADDAGLRVEVAIPETRAFDVKLGDHATVEIDGANAALTGKVGEIVTNIDIASRAFLVKIDLPDTAGNLRPGTFARAGFTVGAEQRLVVPSSAISQYGALNRVFVIEGATARLRMVTTGRSEGPWITVLSGLNEGERVVDKATSGLRDGSPIQVRP